MGYVGAYLQNELEKIGHKPSKKERQTAAARERVLRKYLGTEGEKGQFADPAALFG